MNRTDALNVVKESITQVVPDADLDTLGPDDMFRGRARDGLAGLPVLHRDPR